MGQQHMWLTTRLPSKPTSYLQLLALSLLAYDSLVLVACVAAGWGRPAANSALLPAHRLLQRLLLPVCLLLWAACWPIAASAQVKSGMDWVGSTGHLLPAATRRQLRPRRRLLCLVAAGPAVGAWLLLLLLPPVRWPAERWRRMRCCWVLTLHRRPVIVAGKLLLLPAAAALARLSASCGLLGLLLNIALALSRCLPLHFLLLT